MNPLIKKFTLIGFIIGLVFFVLSAGCFIALKDAGLGGIVCYLFFLPSLPLNMFISLLNLPGENTTLGFVSHVVVLNLFNIIALTLWGFIIGLIVDKVRQYRIVKKENK